MSTPETPNTVLSPALAALQRLIEVVAKLRSPDGGCPWDLAQTPETLIPHVLEEAYEVVDAIRSGNQEAITEELGDLLLQVILQAQIASDYNQFSITEVANSITEKLIRRHPHVFPPAGTHKTPVLSVDEVHQNWEKIKAAEKGETEESAQLLSRKLSRYARTLPSLIAGMKISKKAASAGFEWDNVDGVWEKLHEELNEFKHAVEHEDKAHQQAELGDILFVLINLARWYDLEPEEALSGTNDRFIQRLSKLEEFADRPLTEYTLEEFDKLWQKAKAQLAQEQKSQA